MSLNVANYILISNKVTEFIVIFLIFQVPSLYSADQNILLNIFLSDINNFRVIDSFSTHVSLAYVIAGVIIVQYNFNLAFFDTNLLLNIFLLA